MEAVQESLNLMMEAFSLRLDSIQDQLPTTPGSPKSLASEFDAFKKFVITTFRAVQNQIALLARQVDQGEMRARRNILLIHGLPESQNVETEDVVVRAVVDRIKIPSFSSADISRCHRLGRTVTDRPRPILVKLRDVALRDKIWASKTSLKGSGITLSEFLTKARHDVFVAARQRFGVSKCWTREGNIFVLAPDGTRHRIQCVGDFAAIQPDEVPVKGPAAKPKSLAKESPAAAGEGAKPKTKRTVQAKK